MQDYLTMPWIFAIVVLFIVTMLVVGHLLNKKDTGRSWHLLGWYGWCSGFILAFTAVACLVNVANYYGVKNTGRQNNCREKLLPTLTDNETNSALDIEYILKRTCK